MFCMVSVRSVKSPGTIASSIGKMIIGIPLILLLPFVTTGCGSDGSGPSAEITSFEPASGDYYAGEKVTSSLKIENTGGESRSLWIGYSVQDGTGRWHDAPASPVELEAGEESGVLERSWTIPEENPPVSGPYNVEMSVWDEQPDDAASRLASVSRADAFSVLHFKMDFDSLDRSMWNVTRKKLGRGRLEPENVSTENGRLRLELPANTFNGGEVESEELYLYGTYQARIKVADAPSSLTGFFLYKEPDFENELDIEIFNDPAGRILFTTYSNGRETNNVEKKLPFDPTADFHDYRFDLYPEKIEFYVDGEKMHSFDKGIPEDPMNLYINAWFPTWLAGQRPEADSYTYVEWLKH